ncbi:hypothetical protein PMZ80_008027 [Knufia obscura]|uniref:Uncharacterized protein n=1 Tax=Knufia obscura TaxID=1635080 RepID=A0ABR0RHC2_9EURO|nr:hypothetical protein PMZ80_008027 [Knufia obscura]
MTGLASSSNNSLRLRQAIQSNDIPLVERLLQARPVLLHNPDHTDRANTSLHLAAQAGHAELCELLISKGHDGTTEVTDLIYSNAGNNQGVSVNTEGRTALHLAASHLHVDVVDVLCTEFPRTINRGDREGRTPLLLAAGAQVERTTKVVGGRKNTLQSTEDTRSVEALLRHGADVRAQDHSGNTCLHQACAWGNLKTARVLVQAGADPLRQNKQGWRPDAYSLTVQADVYFRNLVAEFERRRAEDMARRRDQRPRNGGGGKVRLVQDHEDDEKNEFYDATDSGRSRAGSKRSDTTSVGSAENGLGINVTGLRSSEAWV